MQTAIDYRRLYDYRLRGTSHATREAVWEQIALYMYRRMGQPARVLDAGAGRCEFINAIPTPERWAVDQLGCDQAGISTEFSCPMCWSTCPARKQQALCSPGSGTRCRRPAGSP
jgi:hypothetical protein